MSSLATPQITNPRERSFADCCDDYAGAPMGPRTARPRPTARLRRIFGSSRQDSGIGTPTVGKTATTLGAARMNREKAMFRPRRGQAHGTSPPCRSNDLTALEFNADLARRQRLLP
jgi:hypothetical protein